MQQNPTQSILRKKERLRSRKFSQEEPYDRASDEQLINSTLGGGRGPSLQPGTLVQGQASGLSQGPIRHTPSLQYDTQQERLTSTNADFNSGTNFATTTGSQGLNQPEFVNNTGTNNNYQTNFGTENLTQQGFTTNNSASNSYPMSYETQSFTQPGFTNNTGTVLQQDTNQQGLYQQDFPQQGFPQQGFSQQDFSQQGFPQQSFSQQGFSQQGFPQQDFSQQGLSQPGLIGGGALGTGLGLGTAYATSTGIQNFNQAGYNNPAYTGTQGLTQSGQSTGIGSKVTSAPPSTNLSTTPSNTNNVNQYEANSRGTFTFRPIEGKFTKSRNPVGKVDPYCKIKIGLHGGKTSIAKTEGTHPIWNDVITIEKKHNEQFAKIKVKDHDRLTLNDKIGEAKIPLTEVASKGKINQWFPVYKKDQMTGEILMEISFQPRGTAL